MSLKKTFLCLFVGLSAFSMNLKASDSITSLLDVEAKRHSSCSSHHHHHCKHLKLKELLEFAHFRFSTSQFVSTSAERTFALWGNNCVTPRAADQELALDSLDVNQGLSAEEQQNLMALASSNADEVLSRFTLAHANAAGSNKAFADCTGVKAAWDAFAIADIRNTREPDLDLFRAILIDSAALLGSLYDKCFKMTDERSIKHIQDELSSLVTKLGNGLENNAELSQKIQSFAEAKVDIDFPLFETLFEIYAITRIEANHFAKCASQTSPDCAAETIYTISQLFIEAGAIVMDITSFAIISVDVVEEELE
ncbi:MAG: hypothetical protein ACHQUC_05300 [Chlamydiales bacterium]